MNEHATYTTETLEKITFMVQTYITQELAKDFAIAPQIHVFIDQWFDNIVLQIRQSVLSQKLDEISVRYPADWWQAVKERFAPRWFRRRWPIEWNKTTIDVRAIYPKMAMPDKMHFPLARILEGGTAIVDGWGEYTT